MAAGRSTCVRRSALRNVDRESPAFNGQGDQILSSGWLRVPTRGRHHKLRQAVREIGGLAQRPVSFRISKVMKARLLEERDGDVRVEDVALIAQTRSAMRASRFILESFRGCRQASAA